MRLLDLFCGAGGCSVGYAAAGFEVVGVDIDPHPDYPYTFLQADAMAVLRDVEFLDTFDVVHASPPCHDWSSLTTADGLDGTGHLLPDTRAALRAWGGLYVIENVVGAPMVGAVQLCGSEFGLGTRCRDGRWRGLRRHRLFESNVFLMGAGGCVCRRQQSVGLFRVRDPQTSRSRKVTRDSVGCATRQRRSTTCPAPHRRIRRSAPVVTERLPPRR